MATWKLLVALAFAPILYTWYTVILTYWTYRNRVQGYMPTWVPLWAIVIFGYIFFPMITFAALRFGEVGMDIVKSLRPLILCLNPTSSNTIHKLRERRIQLRAEVTEVINTLGPEMFPDFDSARIIADPFRNDGTSTPISPTQDRSQQRRDSSHSGVSGISDDEGSFMMIRRSKTSDASLGGSHGMQNSHLPRNESLGNLGSIALFATRPPSRSRSRSSSSGGGFGSSAFPLKSFSTLDSKEGFNEVSAKIRGAMKERGQQRRRRRSEELEVDEASDGEGISMGMGSGQQEDRKDV